MLSGSHDEFWLIYAKTPDCPALGPVSQYLRTRLAASFTSKKLSSFERATPLAKYKLSSNKLVTLVFGLYESNLPFGWPQSLEILLILFK